MVGAVSRALTGHLVLTTLHTNDAIGAVARLLDMGAEPFLVASALTLVVAQRLVRKPCLQCRAPADPSPRILESLGLNAEDVAKGTLMAGRGCNACGETGFRGRTGVFEVLPITDLVRSAMNAGGGERALVEAASHSRQMSMRDSGIAAALRGDTTLEEVLRVTSEGAYSAQPHCSGCHREVSEDMSRCPWCGTATGVQRCESCSRELDPSWTHCPYCKAPAHVAAVSVPFMGHPAGPPAAH